MFRNGIRSAHPCHTNSTFRTGLAIVAVGAALDLVGLLAIRAIARGIG